MPAEPPWKRYKRQRPSHLMHAAEPHLTPRPSLPTVQPISQSDPSCSCAPGPPRSMYPTRVGRVVRGRTAVYGWKVPRTNVRGSRVAIGTRASRIVTGRSVMCSRRGASPSVWIMSSSSA